MGETSLQGLALNRGKREVRMGMERNVPEGCYSAELSRGRRIVLGSGDRESMIFFFFF